MELIFVRHGEPDWTFDDVDRIDAPLTDRGREQASLTAQRIADEYAPLYDIVVSTALRSQETAQPLADLMELPMESAAGLVELGIPNWSGMSKPAIRDTFDDDAWHVERGQRMDIAPMTRMGFFALLMMFAITLGS